MKYEDIPANLRASMDEGRVLAEHAVLTENGWSRHLTTVLMSHSCDEQERPLYRCFDVCDDLCDFGSVQIMTVSFPLRQPDAAITHLTDRGQTAEEASAQLSAVMTKLAAAVVSDAAVPSLETLQAAHNRLEDLRAWTFTRFRIAAHNSNNLIAQHHATNLFFISTGSKPSEDRQAFDLFVANLYDAVIGHDAAVLPPFPEQHASDEPLLAPDCG